MNNTIQPTYGTQAYSTPTKARETRQTGTQTNSFLNMAAQASRNRMDTLTAGMSGLMGMSGLPTSLMMDLSVRATGQVQTESVEATKAPSLETMLKAKYPKPYLVYMTAGANKFLRIYYGRVKEHLASLEQPSVPD